MMQSANQVPWFDPNDLRVKALLCPLDEGTAGLSGNICTFSREHNVITELE